METNFSKGKMVAAVCTTVLFVGMSMMSFAQPQSQHKKKKNVHQAQQELNQTQNAQRAAQQMDRTLYDRRMTDYRQHLAQKRQMVRQNVQLVQRAKRASYYRYQQQYSTQMQEQWSRYDNTYYNNYQNNPFFQTAFDRRYFRNGTYYQTNRYGVEHLQQAIQYGYAEGYQAGMADRQDRWRSDYEQSDAYLDATYGYNGYYVSQDDYNYYFREGFRRGYEDGYSRQYRYGRLTNGRYTILDKVLSAIITVEMLR